MLTGPDADGDGITDGTSAAAGAANDDRHSTAAGDGDTADDDRSDQRAAADDQATTAMTAFDGGGGGVDTSLWFTAAGLLALLIGGFAAYRHSSPLPAGYAGRAFGRQSAGSRPTAEHISSFVGSSPSTLSRPMPQPRAPGSGSSDVRTVAPVPLAPLPAPLPRREEPQPEAAEERTQPGVREQQAQPEARDGRTQPDARGRRWEPSTEWVPTTSTLTPFAPPAGTWGERLREVADEVGVESSRLYEPAWRLTERESPSRDAVRSAARSEMRLAAASLTMLPVGVAVVLSLFGEADFGRLVGDPFGWLTVALAAALTWTGVRWVSGLDRSEPRVLAGIHHTLRDGLEWADTVADTVGTALLYATAGSDGRQALHAAVNGDPTNPVQMVLETDGTSSLEMLDEDQRWLARLIAAVDDAPDATAVTEILDRGNSILVDVQQRAVERQMQLLRARALGPLLLCFLPAAALVTAGALL